MQENTEDRAKEFLQFQIEKHIKYLFKSYLVLLEEFKDDNILSEEYYSKLRKEILTNGNNSIRELADYLERFDIYFKR